MDLNQVYTLPTDAIKAQPLPPLPLNLPKLTQNDIIRNNILETAWSKKGSKYIYGALRYNGKKDPTAFDCSSFVHWAYGKNGIDIPSNTFEMLHDKRALSVNIKDIQPGDLIITKSESSDSGRHVAMAFDVGKNGTITTIEAMSKDKGVGSRIFNNYGNILKVIRYPLVPKKLSGGKLLLLLPRPKFGNLRIQNRF